jgi:glycosyltransferase involved in cell wall biosynthesis
VTSDFGQPERQVVEGVILYKFMSPLRGIRYFRTLHEYLRLWKLMKAIDADIYIQRAAGMITGMVSLFCQLNGKKFIYMAAHDNDVMRDKRPSWMPGGLIGALIWLSYKYGLRSASATIVQHQQQRNDLWKYYRKKAIIRPSAHRMPNEHGFPDKYIILWVARCEEWKQPELFLKLASAFTEEEFCMVCPKSLDKDYFDRLKAAATKNITFIDYVPFEKIDEYFLKAKIFVNTSKVEGFPNTFIQAAKSKTPILSFNVDPDDILGKYRIGKCAKGDYQLLVKSLDMLLHDEVVLRAMSDNAYAFAKEKYDIKKIIEDDKRHSAFQIVALQMKNA